MLNVKFRVVPSLSIVDPNETFELVVVIILLALNVTAPVYVCVPLVVTFAPRLEVPETEIDAARVIAALRSSLPVIAKAPSPSVAPTVSAVASPKTIVPVLPPVSNVRLFVSPLVLFKVPLKVMLSFVVVSVQ